MTDLPDWPAGFVGSVARASAYGVPPASFALYGRWWQLETWLRTLVYLELRARYGREWTIKLDERASGRAEADAVRRYMRTPDSENPMAYLDVGRLFTMIADDWDLFEPSCFRSRSGRGGWRNSSTSATESGIAVGRMKTISLASSRRYVTSSQELGGRSAHTGRPDRFARMSSTP